MGRNVSSGIALTILGAVANGMDFVIEAHRRPTALLVCGLDALQTKDILAERHRLQTAACRLRRQGLLVQKMEGDRKAHALTERGYAVLRRYALVDPPLLSSGEATIVSYEALTL